MGLKESGLRGSLRSVSTGVSTIPDSVVLLDDWTDNQVTSDRENFNETAFSGSGSTIVEEGVTGGLSRPEWIADSGSPTASDGQLQLTNDESIRADTPISSLDGGTWEIDLVDGNGANYITLGGNSTTQRDGFRNYQDSYYLLWFEQNNELALFVDEGGSVTRLVDGGSVNAPVTVRVTRDSTAEWELFYDGVSQDTVVDDTHTSASYTGVSVNESSGDFANVDWTVIDAPNA